MSKKIKNRYTDKELESFRKIINENEFDFFLSLSDEIEYAHASVIIARKGSVV